MPGPNESAPPSPPKPDNIITNPINVPTMPQAGAMTPIDLKRDDCVFSRISRYSILVSNISVNSSNEYPSTTICTPSRKKKLLIESTCFSRSAAPFLPTSAASTASSTTSPNLTSPPFNTAPIAAPNFNTSERGNAIDTEAIIPPNTIAKLGPETKPAVLAPASAAAKNILPAIAPSPKTIPIRVAISIPIYSLTKLVVFNLFSCSAFKIFRTSSYSGSIRNARFQLIVARCTSPSL